VETRYSSEISSTSFRFNPVSSQKNKIIIFTASYLSSHTARRSVGPNHSLLHVKNGRKHNPAVDGEIGTRVSKSHAR
jgi:hypothetical protein